MDGKRGWVWDIILAPIAAWELIKGLFQRKPKEPETVSRWTESTWQEFLDQEEKERWKP